MRVTRDTKVPKQQERPNWTLLKKILSVLAHHFVFDQAALDKLSAAKRGALVYKQARGNLVTIPIIGTGLKTALEAFKAEQK